MGVINSQTFEFETDDLAVMKTVLNTMVPIWFWHGKADFYCHTKLSPGSFDDGKEDLRDHIVVETLQGCAIVKPKRIYGGVQVYAPERPEKWRDLELACAEANQINKKQVSKPEYMWLTSLEGPYSKPYGEEVEFHTAGAAINHLMNAFETGDKKKFEQECEGEPRWFDGSSRVGYRINQRWDTVYASYCTILYGK